MVEVNEDVSVAIEAADPSGRVDLVLGIRGTAEGLVADCAVRALGSVMRGTTRPAVEQTNALADGLGLDEGGRYRGRGPPVRGGQDKWKNLAAAETVHPSSTSRPRVGLRPGQTRRRSSSTSTGRSSLSSHRRQRVATPQPTSPARIVAVGRATDAAGFRHADDRGIPSFTATPRDFASRDENSYSR